MKTPIRFLFTLLCAAIVSLPSIHASTFTVTNTGDNGGVNPSPGAGTGTLRQAIVDANANAGADMITFSASVTGTIVLSSALPNLSDDVIISGPGANVLTVQRSTAAGTPSFRIFTINSGKTVTISGLTITNGNVDGGGIYNDHAILAVSNSTLSGNSASLTGGGIYNNAFNGSATLTINNSTLSGNSATTGGGGGIFNDGRFSGSATLTIVSTILNNLGGNISNFGTVISKGWNLSSDDASALLNQSTDQNSTDPKLGPLRDNGGPTFTRGLFTGSPATDKGSNPLFLLFDQRGPGFPRTDGDETDVGAFEGVQPLVCPQGQGYWKNNPAAWPVTSLVLGGKTYTKTQLLKILMTPIGSGPKADASLILADQLIAAKLSIANGTDGTPVTSTIMNADSLLTGHPVGSHVKPSSSTGQAMINDANVLDNFNNGLLTLGCGL